MATCEERVNLHALLLMSRRWTNLELLMLIEPHSVPFVGLLVFVSFSCYFISAAPLKEIEFTTFLNYSCVYILSFCKSRKWPSPQMDFCDHLEATSLWDAAILILLVPRTANSLVGEMMFMSVVTNSWENFFCPSSLITDLLDIHSPSPPFTGHVMMHNVQIFDQKFLVLDLGTGGLGSLEVTSMSRDTTGKEMDLKYTCKAW